MLKKELIKQGLLKSFKSVIKNHDSKLIKLVIWCIKGLTTTSSPELILIIVKTDDFVEELVKYTMDDNHTEKVRSNS